MPRLGIRHACGSAVLIAAASKQPCSTLTAGMIGQQRTDEKGDASE